jgi:hypothetical protein
MGGLEGTWELGRSTENVTEKIVLELRLEVFYHTDKRGR